MILAMKASKLLRKECVGNWCYAMKVKEEVKVENIPVVCTFLDVFPEELLGYPLSGKLILD